MDNQPKKEDKEDTLQDSDNGMAKFQELPQQMEIQPIDTSIEEELKTDRDAHRSSNEEILWLKGELKNRDDEILALQKQLTVKTARIEKLFALSNSVQQGGGILVLKNQKLKDQLKNVKKEKDQVERELRDEIASLKTILRLRTTDLPPNQNVNSATIEVGPPVIKPPANQMGDVDWSIVAELGLPEGEIYELLGIEPVLNQGVQDFAIGVEIEGIPEIPEKRPRLNPRTTAGGSVEDNALKGHDDTMGKLGANEQTGVNVVGGARGEMIGLLHVPRATENAVPDVTVNVASKLNALHLKSNVSEGGDVDLPEDERRTNHARDLTRPFGFFCICGDRFKTVGGLEKHVSRF